MSERTEKTAAGTFLVPMAYTMYGRVPVKAASPDDAVRWAVEHTDRLPLPADPFYLDGSFRVDREGTVTDMDGTVCGSAADGYGKSAEDAQGKEPEPLTDAEQRIFLAAMAKEEKACRQADRELSGADGFSLVRVCRSIERKVKAALWT